MQNISAKRLREIMQPMIDRDPRDALNLMMTVVTVLINECNTKDAQQAIEFIKEEANDGN
jgi:hypothetical protein